MELPFINPSDYTYTLPEDFIARFPAEPRDASRLLVYRKGDIRHQTFRDLPGALPRNARLFFNNTRVIRARLIFHTGNGARIEVFLLRPEAPSVVLAETLESTGPVTWTCAIGNLKRWKNDEVLSVRLEQLSVTATLMNRENCQVRLSWSGDTPFAAVVEKMGAVPLPPYLDREVEASDAERYQTVYATSQGAVAAPTAGLHFTDEILRKLAENDISCEFLTLHVSAGTFMPIKTDNAVDHPMHSEQIVIQRHTVEKLLQDDRPCIAVGTTAMRTLESLYWFGVQLTKDPDAVMDIQKLYPYMGHAVDKRVALEAVLKAFDTRGTSVITGHTSIYLLPGYRFRICQGLITNFHQPGSTLLLLIAAFAGPDWKRIYEEALSRRYRFLSYGDSSLLIP